MFTTTRIYVLGTFACLTIVCLLWMVDDRGQTAGQTFQAGDQLVARAIFQQDVDNFSDDARAMSPRDWGNIDSHARQPTPELSFDPANRASNPPALDPGTFETQLVDRPEQSEFRPAEYGTVREPRNFYETQPMNIETGDSGDANSSPLPVESSSLEPGTNSSSVKNPYFDTPLQEPQEPQNYEDMPLESRMERYQGPANQQGISFDAERDRQPTPKSTYDQMVFGQNRPYVDDPGATRCGCSPTCPNPQCDALVKQQTIYHPRKLVQDRRMCRQRIRAERRQTNQQCCECQRCESTCVESRGNCQLANVPVAVAELATDQTVTPPSFRSDCSSCRSRRQGKSGTFSIAAIDDGRCGCSPPCGNCCTGISPFVGSDGMPCCGEDTIYNGSAFMQFNPDLGFRTDVVGQQDCECSSEVFPFEEQDEYPTMREILAQSVYFAEADFMFLQPAFGGNTAISSGSAGAYVAAPFNFDLEPAFRVMAGYESEFGPGLAGEYFQFDNNSDLATFTSDGVQIGETAVYQLGTNSWTRLVAANAGETIEAVHSLEVHSSSLTAFKAIEFKRASINGRFGLQITTIHQTLEANLMNGGGGLLGQLRNNSKVNAFGPRFGIDYFRKVGHTPLQLVSSATGAILFGDRDQQVFNTTTGDSSSIGADEFITHFDIFFGLQMRRHRGENRNTLMRIGFVNQSWIGGGTAIDPNDDFGFQGISLTVGINR